MSRFNSQADMSAAELFNCVKDTRAILDLCHHAAWSIQNSTSDQERSQIADAIQQVTGLAFEMLGPVYDSLAEHEGEKS
jgi:hypothetical protein